jgi:hypothetical protein
VRSADLTPPRPRRRALALVAGLLLSGAVLTACSDDGPPTPAISGENPADVTLPTVPPTTTEAPAPDDEDGDVEDTDTTAPEDPDLQDGEEPTSDTVAPVG